jgi:hypothetical protein
MVTAVPVTQQQKSVTASPGDNIVILVRAKQGNAYSDWASLPYSVPSTSQSGANLTTTNSSTDIKLNGGSLYAGSFPGTTVGTFNVVSGSTTGTGIILNSTGIAGFASGSKKFYIDASTGNAYFGGDITGSSGTIGGWTINSSSITRTSNYSSRTSISSIDGIYGTFSTILFNSGVEQSKVVLGENSGDGYVGVNYYSNGYSPKVAYVGQYIFQNVAMVGIGSYDGTGGSGVAYVGVKGGSSSGITGSVTIAAANVSISSASTLSLSGTISGNSISSSSSVSYGGTALRNTYLTSTTGAPSNSYGNDGDIVLVYS